MIAKLVVWAPTALEALARLARAIDEYVVEGVPTTLPLLRSLCDYDAVRDASFGTATLEPFAAALYENASPGEAVAIAEQPADATEIVRVEVNDKLYRVRLIDRPAALGSAANGTGRRSVPRAARAKRKRFRKR